MTDTQSYHEITDTIEVMMDIHQIARIIEARIFASPEPVSAKELMVYLKDDSQLETVINMIS